MPRQARTWVTAKDLATMYSLSADTVRSKVRTGEWPADRIGQGRRAIIRFSPEQQDIIRDMVEHGYTAKNHDRVDRLLDQALA